MKALILSALLASLCCTDAKEAPVNILFFTTDDMNHDSPSVCGGPIKDLTPHVDQLASQGMRFEHIYSTVAVCMPVRQIIQTARYPHRNGAMGFYPITPDARTLNEQLHDAGYLISMLGKGKHHRPAERFCVDFADDTMSRHPTRLAEATRKLVRMAKEQGKPFFHNVNCYDPHRPFIGMKGPDDLAGGEPPSRWIKPEEITGVPGFLEDLPDVRRELAGYYTNVRRMDDALGAVLKVLEEEGLAENTLVIYYGGDHGMSFPFGKSNNYDTSSRGSLIVRWPGKVKAGALDSQHMVSTLDFAPTILEMTGLPALPDADGRSFLTALKGGRMEGWDRVFTFYNSAFGNNWYPMRTIRTLERAYTWNAWSDGERSYHTENMAGLTWKAIVAAGKNDAAIAERAQFYLHRAPEEFYDLTKDPYERRNLIADPAYQKEMETMRAELLDLMKRTGDPLTEAFSKREDRELTKQAIEALKQKYKASKAKAE